MRRFTDRSCIVLDLDGVVYTGKLAIPGAPEGASEPGQMGEAPPLPEGGTQRNIVDTIRWTQHELMAADDRAKAAAAG